MQTNGAAPRRRAGTRPKKRRRLSVLLAIATVALVVMWAAPLARSGAWPPPPGRRSPLPSPTSPTGTPASGSSTPWIRWRGEIQAPEQERL